MALIFERGTPWEQTESAWLNFFKFLLRSVCTRLILKLSTYILKLSTYWYHPLIPEFWKLPLKEIGVLKYYLLIRSCISTANNFFSRLTQQGCLEMRPRIKLTSVWVLEKGVRNHCKERLSNGGIERGGNTDETQGKEDETWYEIVLYEWHWTKSITILLSHIIHSH